MQAKKYEEGLHNLNGILTFTDYATLATGLGSLLSKGASMAGRYAGKQMAKRADIDKELGTQYVKAVTDFKEAAKQGKLRVKSPKPGTLDIQGYPICNPQTLTHPDIMKNPSYDYIDIDILADFPPNSVGHEFKHAIENYQAALSGIKGSVDDALFANPRLQALMKDSIVSEDEFVKRIMKDIASR